MKTKLFVLFALVGLAGLMVGCVETVDGRSEAGVPFVPEGYVDLDYDGAGKLVLERTKQVRDPHEMGEKAVRLVREGRVRTVDGGDLELEVESICVHGDAPNAPEIARAIRDALERADIELAPLADLHTIAR